MAIVAQLAEHLVVVQDVAGSSPVDRPFPVAHGKCFGNPHAKPHSGQRSVADACFT